MRGHATWGAWNQGKGREDGRGASALDQPVSAGSAFAMGFAFRAPQLGLGSRLPPFQTRPYPVLCCDHSRFGPSTMAMLLGVILFTSWCSASLAKNLIRYLWGEKRAGV